MLTDVHDEKLLGLRNGGTLVSTSLLKFIERIAYSRFGKLQMFFSSALLRDLEYHGNSVCRKPSGGLPLPVGPAIDFPSLDALEPGALGCRAAQRQPWFTEEMERLLEIYSFDASSPVLDAPAFASRSSQRACASKSERQAGYGRGHGLRDAPAFIHSFSK
ncbi:MAG: hypothetical protein ACREVW_16260 [Burkholderiales bacterium]